MRQSILVVPLSLTGNHGQGIYSCCQSRGSRICLPRGSLRNRRLSNFASSYAANPRAFDGRRILTPQNEIWFYCGDSFISEDKKFGRSTGRTDSQIKYREAALPGASVCPKLIWMSQRRTIPFPSYSALEHLNSSLVPTVGYFPVPNNENALGFPG